MCVFCLQDVVKRCLLDSLPLLCLEAVGYTGVVRLGSKHLHSLSLWCFERQLNPHFSGNGLRCFEIELNPHITGNDPRTKGFLVAIVLRVALCDQ
uniref:Uncharacterized protein n=1 Tax=Daucus carota subsp. sativus TaxID=79200 RepID=A0A164YE79_DAUCS